MSASRRKKKTRKSAPKSPSRLQSQPLKSLDLTKPDATFQPAPPSVSASPVDSTSAPNGGSRSARRSTPAPSNDRATAIREADARQTRFVAGVATLAFAVGAVFFFAGQTSRRLDPPSKPGVSTISTPQKLADAVAAEVEKASSFATKRREIIETSVQTAADADVSVETDSNVANADAASRVETLAFVVELNTASKAELTNLPRVGEKLAERIVERREELGGFRSVDDLLGVKGIGEKTLDKMRPYCVVAPLDDAE